jgi:hypothetical protein
MVKPNVKVREIKKEIKVTELKAPESKLEGKIQPTDNSPIVSSTSPSRSPTLVQNLTPRFSESTRVQVREGIQSKDREFSYASMIAQPTRSYDPSIRSSGSQFAEVPVQGDRINPTLRSSNALQDSPQGTGRNIRDNLNPADLEPALRRTRGERDYQIEKVEKYVAKRRTDV